MTGYQKSKSLISAGRPNKYKILHKIVRDRQNQRLRDRQACSNKSYHKLQIKPASTNIQHLTVLVNAGMMEDSSLHVQTVVKVVLQRITVTVAKVEVALQCIDRRVTVKSLRCATSRHYDSINAKRCYQHSRNQEFLWSALFFSF